MAMERERQKLNEDLQKRNMRIIVDEKLASLHKLELAIDKKLNQLTDLQKSVSNNTTEVIGLTLRLDHLEQYSITIYAS